MTIALTLGVVYGLAVAVYQHGGLDALGLRALSQVCTHASRPSSLLLLPRLDLPARPFCWCLVWWMAIHRHIILKVGVVDGETRR